jgi:hypothetical protein
VQLNDAKHELEVAKVVIDNVINELVCATDKVDIYIYLIIA